MDDTVYRQAAIDAAKDWYDGLICGSFKGLKKRLEALPSAQLIQCKECVYGNKMKDTIRCELMDYLPVECDHFCSWAERRQESTK